MLSEAVLSRRCLASSGVSPIQRGEDAGEMAVAEDEDATAIRPQTGDHAVGAGTHRRDRLPPGQPSRKRYQPGRSRRISEVSRPS